MSEIGIEHNQVVKLLRTSIETGGGGNQKRCCGQQWKQRPEHGKKCHNKTQHEQNQSKWPILNNSGFDLLLLLQQFFSLFGLEE